MKQLQGSIIGSFRRSSRGSKLMALGVIVLVVAAGYALLRTSASGFFAASEAESGTVTGPAQNVADSGASAGHAIQFMAAPPPPPPPPGGRPFPFPAGMKPDATNTGLLPNTTLTVISGDQTYGSSFNGQTISNKDFKGFVTVTGANITFSNCKFEGKATSSNHALLDTENASGTITVQDSEFVPSNPSATIDGLWTRRTNVYRANIHGSVDGIKASTATVIQNSFIHDMKWFASDPNQGGDSTHNDAIQILDGSGITITANNLVTAGTDPNSAIQITQDFGATSNVTITSNWADYGGCTFNFAHKTGSSMVIGPVTNNRFGRHQAFTGCAILISTKTTLSQNSGNVWDDTGASIPPPQQHD